MTDGVYYYFVKKLLEVLISQFFLAFLDINKLHVAIISSLMMTKVFLFLLLILILTICVSGKLFFTGGGQHDIHDHIG